jgi:hypothetical protein
MGRAALMTILAFRMSLTPATEYGLEGYTALWIQPDSEPEIVRLGVGSNPFETMEY